MIDPTVYYHQSQDTLDGAIAVEVDDLFTFGNEVHESKMKLLQEKFTLGKYEDVMSAKEGVGFNGRRIRQKPNFEFEVDMKGRRSEPMSLANDSEINQTRAVIGALNWLAKDGRPDASAAACLWGRVRFRDQWCGTSWTSTRLSSCSRQGPSSPSAFGALTWTRFHGA